jgi:hypothetical protein
MVSNHTLASAANLLNVCSPPLLFVSPFFVIVILHHFWDDPHAKTRYDVAILLAYSFFEALMLAVPLSDLRSNGAELIL